MDWKDDFSVGITELDVQHRGLVSCVTEIGASTASNADFELSSSLTKFISLLGTHFSTEERLMRTFKYPDVVAHTAEHHELLADLMATDLNSLPAPKPQALAEYLGKWLANHFEEDKHYTAYFSSILGKKIDELSKK